MGQQHHSPGQRGATERREAPPWVLQSPKRCPEGAYQIAGAIDRLLVRPIQGNLLRLRGIPRATLRFALG